MWPLAIHESAVRAPLSHSRVRAQPGLLPKCLGVGINSTMIWDSFREYNSIKVKKLPFRCRKDPHIRGVRLLSVLRLYILGKAFVVKSTVL